ncbi:NUDIX hydrolase [Vagococcus coleopterorum]|uniref:NUDIX hydrolase n=1 Tax=Vagococcus coleopterorum TaxID=2714946 RepID=A0A6G8AMI3_9ENTE|nr:NUDIX hydrolase [Vagococcus coleopterorum]QIL46169.1 NUDIX hydrolase [Vagococcus coleopterorum]
MDFEEKTIKREQIFKGHVVELVVDQVSLPSGQESTRELILHRGAVGILAITPEDKIILVEQYRKALEQTLIEIPAGKLEIEDKEPIACAARELEEETGMRPGWLKPVYSFQGSPGFSNEVLHLFEAGDLVKVDNPLPADEDELFIQHEWTLAEAVQAIQTGKITDGKTIIAIQYWQLSRLNNN